MVPAPGLRIVYRIVRTDPPTLADFTSAAALGRPPPRTPELARLYDGLSVFSTERQARNKARDLPVLGTYLAAVALEDGAPVRLERTLRVAPEGVVAGAPAEGALQADGRAGLERDGGEVGA